MTRPADVAASFDAIRTFPDGPSAQLREVEEVVQWCELWWSQHRDTAVAEAQEALQRFEAEGPVPDLLRGLGLRNDERFVTRILAWLLNQHESHGLGESFLSAFLEECKLDGLELPSEWDGWEVERERKLSWSGSKKADSPDLLIRGPGVIIIVEHKIKAGQTSPDQYVRYRKLARSRWPDLKAFTVFLRSDPLWSNDPKPGGAFDAVLDPVPVSMIDDLRNLEDGPGELPRVDHDPTGVRRNTLRISQFSIRDATPESLADEVLGHFRYLQRAITVIEGRLDVAWAARRISNAVEPTHLQPPIGWEAYSGSDEEDFWIGLAGEADGTPWVYLSAGISGVWWVVEDPNGVSSGVKAARSRKVREAMPSRTSDGDGVRRQELLTIEQVRAARLAGAAEDVEARIRETFDRLLRAVL